VKTDGVKQFDVGPKLERIKMNYFAKWLVVMLVIFNNSNSSFAGETIRLSNGEFLPYLSEDLKYYGVLSRIVSEAFALEDIEVKYWFFPWGRAIAVAENGAWDGSLGWVGLENLIEKKNFIILIQ